MRIEPGQLCACGAHSLNTTLVPHLYIEQLHYVYAYRLLSDAAKDGKGNVVCHTLGDCFYIGEQFVMKAGRTNRAPYRRESLLTGVVEVLND